MEDANTPDADIFAEALQLPPAERAQYLTRACGSDEALRQRVEELLNVHGRVGDFLETPNADSGFSIAAAVSADDQGRVGRYRLIEKIGEGGCGVVYLAEQDEPVRRQVALKIIKPGMDTREVIARFEAERQALAMMDHPGIAKVFDAGETGAGRPYFVMELIRGAKITDYCDEHALTTEERLKLFVQVCQAIQHAHQKGVIHRDIKPSNILVITTADGARQPVVIDFGIAKATVGVHLTDKTLFTAVDMLIGTPTYMSPEQTVAASADVDTRADIYSLGVLLYELLTGTTPFDTGELLQLGIDEVRRAIREQEPLRPSARLSKMTGEELTVVAKRRQAEPPTLVREVRGDLDWIAMKALEKERARRYETANGLAADVRRFLANETVTARPASNWYRLSKTVSKHRVAFGVLTAFVLLLLTATVTIGVLLRREQHARAEAERARVVAEENRALATSEATRSRQVSKFLQEVILGASPYYAKGQDTTVLLRIIDNAAQRIPAELAGQPEIQAELQLRIGKVYTDLQQYAKGEAQYRAALAVLEPTLEKNRELSANLLYELMTLQNFQGNYAEAEKAIRRSLALRREEFGQEHPNVAESLNALGRTLMSLNRNEEAEPLIRDALAMRRRLLPEADRAITDSLSDLVTIYSSNDATLAEAEALQREVLARWRSTNGQYGRNVDIGLIRIGRYMRRSGRTALAEDVARETVVAFRANKGVSDYDVTLHLYGLALTLAFVGKLEEAQQTIDEIMSYQERVKGNARLAYIPYATLALQSQIEEILGRLAESETTARRALQLARTIHGDRHPFVSVPMANLASVLVTAGKAAEAEQFFGELLTADFVAKPDSTFMLIERAKFFGRLGDWENALPDATRALGHQPKYLEAQITHALVLVGANRDDALRQATDGMLALYRGARTPFVASRTALLCLLLPQPPEKLALLSQLAEAGTSGEMGGYWTGKAQLARALFHFRSGDFKECLAWAEKAAANERMDLQVAAGAVAALARFELKDPAASATLDAARKKFARLPQPDSGDFGGSWKEDYERDVGLGWFGWVTARKLLEEASARVHVGGE